MWGYPYYSYGGFGKSLGYNPAYYGYGRGIGSGFRNNYFNWGFNPSFQINIFYGRRGFHRRPFL